MNGIRFIAHVGYIALITSFTNKPAELIFGVINTRKPSLNMRNLVWFHWQSVGTVIGFVRWVLYTIFAMTILHTMSLSNRFIIGVFWWRTVLNRLCLNNAPSLRSYHAINKQALAGQNFHPNPSWCYHTEQHIQVEKIYIISVFSLCI